MTRSRGRAGQQPAVTDGGDPLAGFPIVIETPVAWGEMDAFRHVNNAVYFRWFESARIAYLDAIGFRGDDGGAGPILHSTHCRFRRPLAYPDTVRIGARTTDVGTDRFTMAYRVVSVGTGEVAAEGGGIVVAYDYGRAGKTALPEAVRRRIDALEDGAPRSVSGAGPEHQVQRDGQRDGQDDAPEAAAAAETDRHADSRLREC